MVTNTRKKHGKPHNKTKSRKDIYSFKLVQKLCKKSANTFNSFEEEYEKTHNPSHLGNVETELLKIFKEPYAPKDVQPNTDFYTYINYRWIEQQKELAKTEKKFYVQMDSFRIVQEKVYKELVDIINTYVSSNRGTKKSNELKDCYHSFSKPSDECIRKQVNMYIDLLDEHIKENKLIEWLVYLNKNDVVSWGAPVSFALLSDLKNANTYRCNISQPDLTFYDYDLYIENEADDQNTKVYKKKFTKNFKEYLNKLFNTFHLKINPEDIIQMEYELMLMMDCRSVANESPEYYNRVTPSESISKYGFDWAKFAKLYGFNEVPKFFICSNLSYLKCIMTELTEKWTTDKWRNYFIYIGIRQIIRFSYNYYKTIHFPFFGEFVSGQDTPYPSEIYAIFGTSFCFNTLLCNEYIDANKRQENMDYVANMATDFKRVFKRILSRNTWLSPKTKQYALLKLKHLKIIIGSPKVLREDPLLDYSSTDPWENILKITNWRSKQVVKLEGKHIIDIPVIDWKEFKLTGKQSYVVNAYYTPMENSIYIPLAYLQKPFIDLDERGIEYNLAHIGYTICHELGHSIDDMGSKYDYKGNLFNWWTEQDRKMFNKKVSDVIKQYETFASYDGIKMDASLSTGENLADIAGLGICNEYLRDFQDKNSDIAVIRELSYKIFYIYIAIANRQNIFKKAIKSQLIINPHPMNKYRTNCPLTRLKIFRSIFNIKKGDKMYWHNTDTIW